MDALFTSIGKHHDRSILHKTVSELFGIPKRVLVAAEENMRLPTPSTVLANVRERRRQSESTETSGNAVNGSKASPKATSAPTKSTDYADFNGAHGYYTWSDSKAEFADPEHLCSDCLPVYGDAIIGTHGPDNDTVTTVHRIGCPHAQRAINHAVAERNQKAIAAAISQSQSSDSSGVKGSAGPRPRVDSVSLRQGSDSRRAYLPGARGATSRFFTTSLDLPVSLQWSEDDKVGLYMAEVVVHAQDRKLLLADCSEVVSETSVIVKTGSLTRDDHATLEFLVKVSCLDQLQVLMDRLGLIRSVMSVERRFGSELL
jgi:(p)ppGpp synthase/HD superfamily hydrolase